MKTHELAKALTHLARVLRAGPNIEFDQLTNVSTYLSTGKPKSKDVQPSNPTASDKATGIALLAQMANYSKFELIDLAHSLNIPIEVRKADAVRDVLGKILKYINENPHVYERLTSTSTKDNANSTSTLARALSILMSQG